jgi:hypothetical protein
MKCPFCNYNDTKVIDSRGQDDNSAIRRRRVCESCGKRFTTYERIDMIPITVIKSDGTREIFDKAKVMNGIMKSCNKRPVTAQQIQDLVDDIENTLMLYRDFLPMLRNKYNIQIILVSHSPLMLSNIVQNSDNYNFISLDKEYTKEMKNLFKGVNF